MERLKGIGVSPGVVAGRAVLLIQRAHALRYQIAPARLHHELQRLDESRGRSREQLVDIQARLAQRRPELSQLFDAQLLMLDDPMLLPRAAAKFVHLATRFEARVKVARDRREMDGKSIMGILLLAAARGSTITISADGADEGDAVAALVGLVASGFGEDVCSV